MKSDEELPRNSSGRTDGMTYGMTNERTDGRTDNAKTISLRFRRGIINSLRIIILVRSIFLVYLWQVSKKLKTEHNIAFKYTDFYNEITSNVVGNR